MKSYSSLRSYGKLVATGMKKFSPKSTTLQQLARHQQYIGSTNCVGKDSKKRIGYKVERVGK